MAREPIYTAHAHVTGGRVNGHGTTSDGALEVELHRPKEMGGEGNGTNPEQLFAVGYAACFESALGAVAVFGGPRLRDQRLLGRARARAWLRFAMAVVAPALQQARHPTRHLVAD